MAGSASPDGPDPVDLHVGAAVRARRMTQGYSQSDLGRALGLSFQQVQKYERGTNRISGSMLYRIARFLEAQPGDFFPLVAAVDPAGLDPIAGLAATRGGADLAAAFIQLDAPQRASVVNIARAIADARQGIAA